MAKANAFQLAMQRAERLPVSAQEQIGREMLERIDELVELRTEFEIGNDELDAGLGEELDRDEFITRSRTARPE